MRNIFCLLLFTITFICLDSKAQDSTCYYQQAYEIIDSMLTGKTQLNFKNAVLTTENAYLDGQLDYVKINGELEVLARLVKAISATNFLTYNETDKYIVQKQASIFKVLTDTIPIFIDSTHIFLHLSYTYDFVDNWGQNDWTKMFVSKLLVAGNGNCHSLPYLYKILAEEFQVPAYLSFAPNHIYIKSHCKKTGWYNTELTSANFPVDAWIMASGYVPLEAIRNGLYMDTLSLKQSVAYCLLDLAQGFKKKFGNSNPDFVVKCCKTVLNYHPSNVNAMLTKAEAQKQFIDSKMKEKYVNKPDELFEDKSIKAIYLDMEQTYVQLHQLGYRRMPKEMYLKWMGMLKNESKEYFDKKVIVKFKN